MERLHAMRLTLVKRAEAKDTDSTPGIRVLRTLYFNVRQGGGAEGKRCEGKERDKGRGKRGEGREEIRQR